MAAALRFLLNGEICEVDACAPTTTLLEFLREDKKLCGTKEGCAEGDCGACTVVIAGVHAGELQYRAVNSCIQFLPTVNQRAVFTVEALSGQDGELHPVQQAMVDCHASQCGFCTPGIVMSLFALHQDQDQTSSRPDRAGINRALAGNLCRCTGYGPIIKAAGQCLPATASAETGKVSSALGDQLRTLATEDSLNLPWENGGFHAPRTLAELHETLEQYPQATLLAGGTDAALWVTKQLRELPVIISTTEVAELQEVTSDPATGDLAIGAAVTYTQAWPYLEASYPEFIPLLERLGAAQVRNAGTVGGNIANGSPIGDMPPGLIALNASLTLSSKTGRRQLPLEDFFLEYGKQDLQPGEILETIHLPAPAPGQEFRTYKISKRIEQDISALCAAFALQIEDGQVKTARVCYGGLAGTPMRARECEASLVGAAWNEKTIKAAMQSLTRDYDPISDMRASASYRMRVAQNLLHRFYLETTGTEYATQLVSDHA